MGNRNASEAICAHGLQVSLGGRKILDGVSIALEFGQLGVIAGPNGAGKSTLLRCLLGLLPVQGGSLWYEGIPNQEFTREQRAQRVAYVPQRSLLDAALPVEEVLVQGRFGRSESKRAARQVVGWAMERVGIVALRDRNYLELSGGEKRLVLIARALCTEAKILCLDEPTSSLDIANRLRILELLRFLASDGYAVLAVLHELQDVYRFADTVCLLIEGRVAHAGETRQVVVAQHIAAVYDVEMRAKEALGFRLLPGSR